MNPSRRSRKSHYFSSSPTTTLSRNEQTPTTTEIPISSPDQLPIPITIHLPNEFSSAIKIQSTYRSHRIRTLFRTISTVNNEADQLQRLIQQQETVDAIRKDEREKLRMNEALMSLLLRLDAVPGGVDPTVREARRKVSRRIVGLQEVLDSVTDERVVDEEVMMWGWEEMVGEMEREVWEERGGGKEYGREMERFCVEKLGFRCMERFLRGV